MLSFIRRIASKLSTQDRDARWDWRSRGPIARMMDCDRNNLELLARSLAGSRHA